MLTTQKIMIMSRKTNSRSPFYLIYSIFIIYGLGSTFVGFNKVYQGYKTNHWKTVSGEIKFSKIYDTGLGKNRIKKPIVKYIYLVNGTQYQGGNIYFDDENSRSNLSYTNQMVSKYPAGKQALVYYNPAEPQSSVLETGIAEIPWIPLIFGMGFTVAGSGFLWISKSQKI
jgi:Protein of unknown function (DUF3592)